MAQKTYDLGFESPSLGPDNRIKSTGPLMRHENARGYIDLGVDTNNDAALKTNKEQFNFNKAIYAPEMNAGNGTHIVRNGVFDNGQRVYSAHNKPSPSALGCIAASANVGHGGGINADLLDGKHASEFAEKSHSHSYIGGAYGGGRNANTLSTDHKLGYFYEFLKDAPNLPVGAPNNANAIVSVSTHRGGYSHQFAMMGNQKIYHRSELASAYSDWSEIWTSRKLNEELTFTKHITANRLNAGYDSGRTGSVNASNWFRSSGPTGWYNQTYGGGINMTDATWVRVSQNKQFRVDNNNSHKAIYALGGICSDARFFCNNLSGEGGLVGNYQYDRRTDQIIWTLGLEHTTHKTHYGIGYHYGKEITGGWTHQIVLKERGVIHTHLSLNGWAWFKNHIYTKSATGVSKSRVLTHADFQRETRTRIYRNVNGNGESNITLSQPYTDFDELLVVYANDHKASIATTRVDVAAVQEHLALRVSTAFSLVDGGLCWRVKPSANKKTLVVYDENCLIWTIYGIKKNKLIANY